MRPDKSFAGDPHDPPPKTWVQQRLQLRQCVLKPPAGRNDDFYLKVSNGIYQRRLFGESLSWLCVTRMKYAVKIKIESGVGHTYEGKVPAKLNRKPDTGRVLECC